MLDLFLILALEQQPSTPEPPAPRGYVQGSVFLTSQPAGTAGEGVSPALGGQTVAIAAAVGMFLAPRVAVEGEFVLGGTLAAPQTESNEYSYYRGAETYLADSRDLLFVANLRWKPVVRKPIEIVASGGLAISRVRKLNVVRTDTFPTPGEHKLPDWAERIHALNFSIGADIPVSTTAALAVVPGFRLRWVDRSESTLAAHSGTAGVSVQFGASVRGNYDRRPFTPAERGPAYVQGSFLVATQPAGQANHRVSPPLGGETFGVSASGGAFVTPAVAIEGEVLVGRTLSAPQRFSYFWREDYTAGVRDLLFSGNVRFRGAATGPVEFVLGGGLVYTRLSKANQVRTDGSGPIQRTERYPDYYSSELTPHVGGGIDVPIALGSRVAIGPTFRFRWMFREREGQGADMGVGRQLFQAGVSVRVRL